ncbi:MAG: MBL fold metallo-hydrolase [Alphaproteobacteria bacterium]|nr:MBL fold metallo-hydrolase [Alphaproteobacteria bacterium]
MASAAPPAAVSPLRSAQVLPVGMEMADPTRGLSVTQLAPGLRYVLGVNVSSNTFVVDTSSGPVVIDTSRPPASAVHKQLLEADGVGRASHIIVTHGHGDHTGGVALWRQGGGKVVAQANYVEFLEYQSMLGGFFGRRNAAQFQFGAATPAGQPAQAAAAPQGPAPQNLMPDITFDKQMSLDVGDTRFELFHTPGETPDHLTVWVPGLKAAFVGDNYYESFPNMYTLRGTRPRWPLEYIASIDKVLSLDPEMLLPSHGRPVVGRDEVRRRLTQYRDAIAHVHDAVLAGMNGGKDVYTLMQEIRLPPELDVGEGYGKIAWTVRGIHEGYVGWFKGDPVEMFEQAPSAVSDELVALAGGPGALARRANELLAAGDAVGALQLTSVGLEGAKADKSLLRARIAALTVLADASTNRNEMGWLSDGLRTARAALGE